MRPSTHLDMFDYWSPDDQAQHDDHVGKTPMEMVEEFRVTMGQKKDFDMSAKLMQEEYHEWFNDWYCDSPPEKELKELADLVYVIYGYANSMNWNLDEALRRVHENNMERCVWPDGTVKKRIDGKVLKNPDAPQIDLSDLV